MNTYTHRVLRKRGVALMTAIIFFVVISVTIAIGLSTPVVREYTTARDFEKSKGAFYLAESGQEDAIYRIKNSKTISAQEIISLAGNTATTTITTIDSNNKSVASFGDILRNTRRSRATLTTITGNSFVYGVQAGAGGVYFKNGSSITGNLYSAGPICGGGATGATCTGGGSTNTITGTVISGGTTGSNGIISNIANQSGASMYAGTIKNSTISGGAFCNTISGSSTSTCQTLPSQPPPDLAISATDIANWETTAANGGSVTCSGGTYKITNSVTIGPKKIPCDLEIDNNTTTVTLTGPLWVVGDFNINNNPNIKVSPTLSGQTVVIIADNASNPTNDSKIVLGNNPVFTGAPGGNSWVMLISENTSASQGGNVNAIDLQNNAIGDLLLYARLGNILLQNNAVVNEVTGYKITLQNNANVKYSNGLQNALFTSGPGGAWGVMNWKEGQ